MNTNDKESYFTSITILPRDLPSAVISKKTLGLAMTVAILLNNVAQVKRFKRFGCKTNKGLLNIQQNGWRKFRMRMRTRHVANHIHVIMQ